MIRILVVDDEGDNTALLVRRLIKLGYEVIGVTNSTEVLNIIEQQKVDLILLDIMMPEIDGFEIAKRLTEDSKYKDIPIIFLSAKDSVESKVRGLELGAVDYITKPFEFKELQARIQVALSKYQQIKYILQQRKDLEEKANKDFLTGLFNRRHIDYVLEQMFEDTNQNTISLLMADLDYFKKVNDAYGHDQGDIVLKGVAQIIKEAVRTTDICGRYGGEEFIIILPSARKEVALSIAERIRVNVENTIFTLQENKVNITISIGLATLEKSHQTHKTVEEWVKSADQALYRAKDQGRNRVVQN